MALLRAVRETPEERVEWLAGVYLDPTALPGRRAQLIDAFVESGSLAAQRVVVKYVSEARWRGWRWRGWRWWSWRRKVGPLV